MPTVIILDTSLSMCRPVQMADVSEPYQFRNLAVHGLTSLLDYMNINCKLEFVAFMTFSSYRETIVPFTRDFDNIKGTLIQLEYYDRARIKKALEGVQSLIMEEWGAGVPCQVILVTDGLLGPEIDSLKADIENYFTATEKGMDDNSFPLPFPFPCKLHVTCIANSSDPCLQAALPTYQKLIDINGNGGQVFIPDGLLSFKSVQGIFMKLADLYYKPFHGVLHCGNLTSNVSLSPPPEPFCKHRDFDIVKAEMSTDIVICGFISITDVASPPSHSRHLVLPLQSCKEETKPPVIKLENCENTDDESANEDGKQPSFCVLLHGSLKVEGMVAICHLGGDWYGMLYSWADSKKKSNLMLSAFEPGNEVIPWLGSFGNLGPVETFTRLPSSEVPTLPIKPSEKRSYAQNCVVWIKQSGLQADIQKILRHARKLPEKTQNFYKELNRLRRAALSFGFYELLDGMATILDRECTLLPGSAHPDAALQLTHCANALRNGSDDYNTPLVPLRTKLSSDD
ncbi:integrator complex subunit 14-like [Stegodyphus dumicola]|uniref:integrator complex subunit 14-like n=1 Tax=Stegodyphus dumicola TaxID=202533 RepID=UPI0015B2644E|nr:integrator complex subunit 14-like [Stegodyphus dumicola]